MGKVRIRSRYRGRSPQAIVEAASAADTVTAQVSGVGGSDFPNEPAGYTRICEHNYAVLPGGASGGGINYGASGIPAGGWWRNSDENLEIINDAGESGFFSTYLRIAYPVGLLDGRGPNLYTGWLTHPQSASTNEMKSIYVSQRFRFMGNDSDPGNWEENPVGTKFNYQPCQNPEFQNQFPIIFRPVPGVASNTLAPRPQHKVTLYTREAITGQTENCTTQLSSIERQANVNAAAAIFDVGDWCHMEEVLEMNTPSCPATANARWRVWVNGVLTHDYQNRRTLTTLHNRGWWQYHLAPVFGGTSFPARTREDFIDVAHTYVSGIPRDW